MPTVKRFTWLLSIAMSMALVAAAGASADIKIQTMPGLYDSFGITADHRGNVYVLSEFLKLLKISPDGTPTVVPWNPPPEALNMPKAGAPVWGPDDKIWFSCRPLVCHVDVDGGGLIDTPITYGTPGPDGNFWRVDGATGAVMRTTVAGVTTSFAGLPAGSTPSALGFGLGDNLWFIYGGSLVRVSMNGIITSFPLVSSLALGSAFAVGPDGNLWASLNKEIARISPTGQVLGIFHVEDTPTSLAAGPDGDVWFTYFEAAGVGRITPSGHVDDFSRKILEYDEPTNVVRAADGGMWVNANRNPMTWRIDPDPPAASTDPATGVGAAGATLNAAVDPMGGPTSAMFQWGTTTAYGASSAAQDMGDGEGAAIATATLDGLRPSTTYHYRVVAVNGMRTIYGADRTLTTAAVVDPPPLPPEVFGASTDDADHDGYPVGVDCNDHAASVHPGAVDRPGDKIDQDCSGSAATFGHLAPPIDARWATHGRSTRFTRLVTGALPAHVAITLSCTGRGCGFKTSRLRTAGATKHIDLLRHLKGSRLRRGAVVVLRLSRAGQATTIIRWRIGPPTRRATTCLAPGTRKEAPCS